jgi:glycosyltransferase involved in cell wall biosynthesis
VISGALIEELGQWEPDFLIIKGAGTTIGSQLAKRFDTPIGVIIGGNHTDNALARAEIVLTETSAQERFLRLKIGSDRLIRLPKLVSPTFVSDSFDGPYEFDLAVVSKFERHKNHEALKPLLDHDLSIVLVGEGSLRPAFEQYSGERRATVVFADFVRPEEVARILKASRLLVHPSLSEGFPRVVVEAMASGTPAVCLRGVVGWPLQNGQNSLLVAEPELADSVVNLLGDRQLLDQLGRGALETFRREFSISSLRIAVDNLNQAIVAADNARKGWQLKGRAVRFALVGSPRVIYGEIRKVGSRILSLTRNAARKVWRA